MLSFVFGAPLVLGGCLIGFDAQKLTGGGDVTLTRDGGATPAGGGAQPPGEPLPKSMCRDFAAWTAGAAVPNWVDGRGTWRITSTSQGPALGQIETTDNGGPYRFVTWDGSRRFADCTASSATVLSDQASENCVLSRVQDASNFYALCLKEASHRRQMGPPQYEWVLERVVSDSETRLAGGNLDIAPGTSHSLILNARGASLTALLDRVAQPVVIDTTYSNGAVGLATDGAGGFSTFCLATN